MRRLNIDYLRITACLMVVFLHISAQNWHNTDVFTIEWKIFNLFDCLVRSAVPLFFMISGVLFLSKKSMPPLSALYKKNILKLLIIYVFWSVFYAIDSVGIKNIFDLEQILYYIVNAKYHLWYLPVLIGVYFILPILWIITRYEDGKYLKYTCLMFFVFGIMKVTLLDFEVLDYPLNQYFTKFSYALSGYSGYCLFAYLLDKYKLLFRKISTKLLGIMFLVIVLFVSQVNILYAQSLGEPTSLFYEYNTLFVFLEANILFLIYLRLPRISMLEKYTELILKVSKNTLFVYLFHVFVIEKFSSCFHITSLSFYPMLSVPILTIVIFIFCQMIAEILNKVPFIKTWLI